GRIARAPAPPWRRPPIRWPARSGRARTRRGPARGQGGGEGEGGGKEQSSRACLRSRVVGFSRAPSERCFVGSPSRPDGFNCRRTAARLCCGHGHRRTVVRTLLRWLGLGVAALLLL